MLSHNHPLSIQFSQHHLQLVKMGKYDDYDWDELPCEVKEACETLGYNKEIWDKGQQPASENKDWEELTAAEKEAAKVLGYDQNKWDS